MNKRFYLGLILACLFSNPIIAQDYWVIGSYTQALVANKEAVRLSSLTGAEISISEYSVSGSRYFRLLITSNHFNDRILNQLVKMNIEPWYLSSASMTASATQTTTRTQTATQTASQTRTATALTEPSTSTSAASPDSPGQEAGGYETAQSDNLYLVAASSTEVEEALEMERNLSDVFISVRGETALIEGQVIHRVLIGPLSQSEIESARSKLAELGFEDTPVVEIDNQFASDVSLPSLDDDYSDAESIIEQVRTRAVTPVVRVRVPSKPANPTGYNLARLPKNKPVFSP